MKSRVYLGVTVHYKDGATRENDLLTKESHLINTLLKQDGVTHVTVTREEITEQHFKLKLTKQ